MTRKALVFVLFAVCYCSAFSQPIIAGPAAIALGNCMADNTTGKDRKSLAQWIFSVMSHHPDIQPYANLTEEDKIQFDKNLARLATKLMTESCKEEARVAVKTEGGAAIKSAFGSLGKVAMSEITSYPTVTASFANFTQYIDKSKFEKTFK